MATTVLEQITAELKTRLNALTTNGYGELDYVEVVRPTLRGENMEPKSGQIVLRIGSQSRAEDLDCPGNPPAIAWKVVFNIYCNINVSESDTNDLNYYTTTMHGDVVHAVTDAGNMWYSFGGLSIDANWMEPEVFEADGSMASVNVPIEVTFRHDENNAFNVRA